MVALQRQKQAGTHDWNNLLTADCDRGGISLQLTTFWLMPCNFELFFLETFSFQQLPRLSSTCTQCYNNLGLDRTWLFMNMRHYLYLVTTLKISQRCSLWAVCIPLGISLSPIAAKPSQQEYYCQTEISKPSHIIPDKLKTPKTSDCHSFWTKL